MSTRDPRAEAADIARAARRLIERDRALGGGGELLAAGVARARARAEANERERVLAPAATHAAGADTATLEPPARAAAALAPPPEAEPAAPVLVEKASGFKLTAPEPARVVAAPPVSRARIEVSEPLPPFTDDLYPSALDGAREGLLAASLPVLAEVAAQARACRACGLCETRTNAVPGVGSAATGIVFVGEAPGADEDAQGEPFVGRAGQLLTRMIAGMDSSNLIPGVPLTRETVYICNVLKCRPPENRNPLPHEIEACSPYVMRQLEALQPRVICCLGKFAAELLLGLKGTIAGMRGKTYRWRGAKLIVTYHPAYVLRSPHTAREPVWEDLKRLAQEYLTD